MPEGSIPFPSPTVVREAMKTKKTKKLRKQKHDTPSDSLSSGVRITMRTSETFGDAEAELAMVLSENYMPFIVDRLCCSCGSEHCQAIFRSEPQLQDGGRIVGNVVANTFAVLIEQSIANELDPMAVFKQVMASRKMDA
jgi:hypothetical protein